MGAPIMFFDIAGPDVGTLRSFYSGVFGWAIDARSMISAESTGGVRGTIREDPAGKLLYLGVSSIAATLSEVERAGGQVILPRTEVPGVVTFALFRDPAGNVLGLAEFGSYPT